MLGFVERRIGCLKKAFRHAHRPAIAGQGRGDPYADGDPASVCSAEIMGEFQLLDGAPDFFRNIDRAT
jgi:hypothetical protein